MTGQVAVRTTTEMVEEGRERRDPPGQQQPQPADPGEAEKSGRRHRWAKLCKTFFLALALFSGMVNDTMVNNGLPDLVDIYQSSVATFSMVYTTNALGRLITTIIVASGYVNITNWQLSFFYVLVLMSMCTALVPFVSHVALVHVLCFVMGQISTFVFIGTSTECLQIWRGENSEPYMHFLHTSTPVSSIFASAVATLVLSGKDKQSGWELFPGLTGVRAYFPLVGMITLMLTPAFLYMGLRQETRPDPGNRCSTAGTTRRSFSVWTWGLIIAFVVTNFSLSTAYVIGNLLPLYAAKSGLGLSRVQGSTLATVFWTCFMTARAVAVFSSLKIPASKSIYVYLMMYMCPCLFVIWKQADLTYEQLLASVAILATGAGPLESAAYLIYDSHMELTPWLIGIINCGFITSIKVLPVLFGQVVEVYPAFLFVCSLFAISCLVIFATLSMLRPDSNDDEEKSLVAEQEQR